MGQIYGKHMISCQIDSYEFDEFDKEKIIVCKYTFKYDYRICCFSSEVKEIVFHYVDAAHAPEEIRYITSIGLKWPGSAETIEFLLRDFS